MAAIVKSLQTGINNCRTLSPEHKSLSFLHPHGKVKTTNRTRPVQTEKTTRKVRTSTPWFGQSWEFVLHQLCASRRAFLILTLLLGVLLVTLIYILVGLCSEPFAEQDVHEFLRIILDAMRMEEQDIIKIVNRLLRNDVERH